jgi:hypothetical protein
MPPKIPEASLLVLYVSPGAFTDAGGYVLTPHGIRPVPGWGEEIVADLAAAVSTYHAAAQLDAGGVARRDLQAAADQIVRSHAGAIRGYAEQLGAPAAVAS